MSTTLVDVGFDVCWKVEGRMTKIRNVRKRKKDKMEDKI